MFYLLFVAAALLMPVILCANLVGASTLPMQTIDRSGPGKSPYRFLRITMHGRVRDTGVGNGLIVYHPLLITFFYGPGPAQACNPAPNQQAQKISLVQGPAAPGTNAVPGAVTVVAGAVTAVATGAGGTLYASPPTVSIYDPGTVVAGVFTPGGTGATVTATLAGGVVTGYVVGAGGTGYTANATAITSANPLQGFQTLVAAPLVAGVFAKDWINDGIYACWIDSPPDVDLQVGAAGAGVVPAGGYLTPTGDGGVGATIGLRLPLPACVTVHKYTGDKGRSWSGKAWHIGCVPSTFFNNDDMSPVGQIAWAKVKASLYSTITDGTSVMAPIMVSSRQSQISQKPTSIVWAPLILPGTDVVRGIVNPVVNNTLGELRHRKERHGQTF